MKLNTAAQTILPLQFCKINMPVSFTSLYSRKTYDIVKQITPTNSHIALKKQRKAFTLHFVDFSNVFRLNSI